MGDDSALRSLAVALQLEAEAYGFGYQQEWCGVPVIRLPDDILILQEIVWNQKPGFIVETGVARGGSLVLSASLMSIARCTPKVLGVDVQILDHARTSIENSPYRDVIELWEGNSACSEAASRVEEFIQGAPTRDPGLLILDSDHSHSHVLGELEFLTPSLPVGSLILVADTLIEEMPSGHYLDRPWDRGNSPWTAIQAFMSSHQNYVPSVVWGKRGLLTEFREGVLEKVAP